MDTLDLLTDQTSTASDLLTASRNAAQRPSRPDWTDCVDALTKAASTVEAALRTAIVGMRTAGASWEQIAAALGVSRQAAWERYHQHTR